MRVVKGRKLSSLGCYEDIHPKLAVVNARFTVPHGLQDNVADC